MRTPARIISNSPPDSSKPSTRAARRIHLAPLQVAGEVVAGRREMDYDVLVLAFGSRAKDFGTPGVVEHCHFIDSQDQADSFNAMPAQVVRSFVQGGNINIAIDFRLGRMPVACDRCGRARGG